MQQPDPLRTNERLVSAHTARSWIEAVVVRGLLESAGIPATELGVGNPAPIPDLAPLLYGIEIHVLQSREHDARRVIAEYLANEELADEDRGEGQPDEE
jgi:hypothetical protein